MWHLILLIDEFEWTFVVARRQFFWCFSGDFDHQADFQDREKGVNRREANETRGDVSNRDVRHSLTCLEESVHDPGLATLFGKYPTEAVREEGRQQHQAGESEEPRRRIKTPLTHQPQTETSESNHQEAQPYHQAERPVGDRKSTRLNSSHLGISYAVFCL